MPDDSQQRYGEFVVERLESEHRGVARQESTGRRARLAIFLDAKGDQVLDVAKARASLGTRTFVDVLGAGAAPIPWIATEAPNGASLSDLLAQHGHLPWSELATVARAVTRALSAAHAAGIAHGALGPQTVFFDPTTDDAALRVRVLDLGFGALEPQAGPFAAPEARMSPRADVFSLGALLAFALTGAVPRAGVTAGEITAAASSAGAVATPLLALWLARCLQLDPAFRFSDAADAQGPLGHALSEREAFDAQSPRVPMHPGGPQHPYRATPEVPRVVVAPRKPIVRLRFLVAALVVLAGTSFFLFRAPMRRLTRPPSNGPRTVSGVRPAVDIPAHYAAVFKVAPTPDDGAVWSTSWDDSLHLWDLTSGKPLHTLSPAFGRGSALAVDEKTGRVAAGGTVAIKVWTKEYALERTIPVASQQTSLAFSRDGTRLFAGSFDGKVRAYELATGEVLHTMTGHSGRVLSIDVSPDGESLVSAGDDGIVRVWRTKDGSLMKAITAHSEPISCVRIGPDGQAIATASDDGTAGLFLRDFGKRILTFRPGDDEVWSVAFDPNGRTLAIGGKSGPIYLVSAMTGTSLRALSGHEKGTLALAFSHDGKTLVSGGGDQHVRIWRGFE